MRAHPVRHQEFLVLGPVIVPLGETGFLLSQRLPVGLARILFGRRTVADMTIHNDQRGTIGCGFKDLKRTFQHLPAIDIPPPRHIPPTPDAPPAPPLPTRPLYTASTPKP